MEKYWESFYGMTDYGSLFNEMQMRVLFETTFNIRDHDSVNPKLDPTPLVSYNKLLTAYNPLEREYQKIILLDLPKISNMSIPDILNMSTYEYECLVSVGKKLSAGKNDLLDEIKTELGLAAQDKK